MQGSMAGKIVIITGGARGLGKTMADYLAREGAAVWVTSRKGPQPSAQEAARPGEVREVHLEITEEASVRDLFLAADEAYGRVDVLVNNAGVGIFKPVIDTTLEEWEWIMKTNLTGLFLCTKEAFTRMKSQGGGRIINIASVSGYIPIQKRRIWRFQICGARLLRHSQRRGQAPQHPHLHDLAGRSLDGDLGRSRRV